MTEPQNAARRHAKKRLAVILLGGVAGVAVGLAGVYGIGASQAMRRPTPACRRRRKPPSRHRAARPRRGRRASRSPDARSACPSSPSRTPTAADKTLADWRGRTVLLNLWATWCVPCRKEMPALDALQAKLGGADFEVVAVNIDTRNLDKPKAWLKEVGISTLAYYADPSAKVFQDLKAIGKAFGMPTTLLIDAQRLRARHAGRPRRMGERATRVKLVSAALKK